MSSVAAVTWHAVDEAGNDLATGRSPRPPGAPTPAAALAGSPVVDWPLWVVDGDGRRRDLTTALGPGGARVERLLGGLVSPAPPPPEARLAQLASDTPAGRVDVPVALVSRAAAARAASGVDAPWAAVVAERRSGPRQALVDAGRGDELEAALHVAMLLAVERLAATHDGVDVRAASGAQLWLLGGMVTAALADHESDHFGAWAELLTCGLWPIGPSGGRLVVGDARA